jgi:hypothetical protein
MSGIGWLQGALGRFLDSGRPDDPLAARTWSRRESVVTLTVFAIAAAWAAHQLPIGWNHTISGPYQHGFRQAQTALSVVRMLEGGPLLSYETPVLGPPWSVPFEFPLYQWTVAALSAALGLDVIPAGRLASVTYFLATLAVLWFVLAELGVRPVHRLVFLALPLVSPLYVFWSRCLTIESAALFAAMAFLYAFLRALRSRRKTAWVLSAALGGLAAAVKVTTWVTFAALAVAVTVAAGLRAWRTGGMRGRAGTMMAPVFCGIVLPLALLTAWTDHADRLKRANPIGAELTSRSRLVAGMFASFRDGANPSLMASVLHRTVRDVTGRQAGAILPLLAAALSGRRRGRYAICLAAFVLPLLLFGKLHLVHKYYTYANGIFLLAASGWAIEGLLTADRSRRMVGYVLFAACVALSIYGYAHPPASFDPQTYTVSGLIAPEYRGYAFEQATNDRAMERLGHAVAAAVPPGRTIVGLGMDWSAELPFYAARPGLMLPNWVPRDVESPVVQALLARLPPADVGGLVLCDAASRNREFASRLARQLGLDPTPRPVEWCVLFASRQ